MNWVDDAACRTLPKWMFFAERGQNQEIGKQVCFGCPVQTECLREHLGEVDGVWGGTTPVDRVLLRSALAGRQMQHGRRGWQFGCRCHRCSVAHDRNLEYERKRRWAKDHAA